MKEFLPGLRLTSWLCSMFEMEYILLLFKIDFSKWHISIMLDTTQVNLQYNVIYYYLFLWCNWSWCLDDRNWFVFLWLQNSNKIWKWPLWTILSSRIPVLHNLDLDSQHSLTHQYVTNSIINVILGRLTRVNLELK